MILISSAAYVEQDLAVEVGRLPPAFLPIGNKRLYEYQIELLKVYGKEIFLSLPSTFNVPMHDLEILSSLGVTVIKVPDGLTLGNSVVFSWSSSGKLFTDLSILHGDTLFLNQEYQKLDSLSVHRNEGAYHRAQVRFGAKEGDHYGTAFVEEGELVVSGLFRFSNPQKLMQGILKNNGDFIKGLQAYSTAVGLSDVENGDWLDFGHLNSFFNSRSKMTTQRSFNMLSISPRQVTKSSNDLLKMKAEWSWFSNLPKALTLHTPALLSSFNESEGLGKYKLEYLYLLPLNDLMVFGCLSDANWRTIIEAAGSIISDFSRFGCNDTSLDELDALYLPKTIKRLRSIKSWDFSGDSENKKIYDREYLESLAERVGKYITPTSRARVAIVHGDFCFSNILYDSRTQSLKLIDPRGIDANGKLSIYGDQRYDVAKLFHSVVAGYDYIISGRYVIEDDKIFFYDEAKESILYDEFDRVFSNGLGFNMKEIIAINIHLFLLMIALHADRPDRQKAMLLNVHRLIDKYLKDMK